LPDPDVKGIGETLKQQYPRKPVVAVGADGSEIQADRFVEVNRPERLCDTLRELVGEPKIIPSRELA
jgi:hypothetical protein